MADMTSTQQNTRIVELPVAHLVRAVWNSKTDGTPEQIEKLMASIKEDASAGVLAVRQLKKDCYEVMDGNHRLTAIQRLKWTKAICEDFGTITQAKAVIIARRRNHVWFDDDILKYADLFKNVVLKEYSIDQLSGFMPDSRDELEGLAKLLDFDFNKFRGNGDEQEDGSTMLSFHVAPKLLAKWRAWQKTIERAIGEHPTNEQAFDRALSAATKADRMQTKR